MFRMVTLMDNFGIIYICVCVYKMYLIMTATNSIFTPVKRDEVYALNISIYKTDKKPHDVNSLSLF